MEEKSKFWLMRMHQIKIFHIFMPNLGEIFQFGQKCGPFKAMAAKKLKLVLKRAFNWCIVSIQRVKHIFRLVLQKTSDI